MISCAASDSQDVVLKKSLYQYITTWAAANPELMLLTINMLLKDCGDQDPTIRGLALRSLCSLRISNLTEYLVRYFSESLVPARAGAPHLIAVGLIVSPILVFAGWLRLFPPPHFAAPLHPCVSVFSDQLEFEPELMVPLHSGTIPV